MRFPLILIMALPPSDDDLTVPGAMYTPDAGDGTQPLASPYQGDAGAPPPPPTGPAPQWRPAQAPLRPPAPKGQGGLLFVAGALVAVALLAFAGIAFALAQVNGNPQHTNTVAYGATSTPHPTTTSATTPTVSPTTAPTIVPTSSSAPGLPPAPPGFTAYTSSDGIWGLNYPQGANIQTTTTQTDRGDVPTTTFALDYGATFAVFDMPQRANKIQQVLNLVATALNADNVQIVEQGTLPLPSITWQEVRVMATVDGEPINADLYYAPHAGGATVISMSAPPDQYALANETLFQTMLLSFTYLS
jgi:hypothetical protein